MKVRWAVNDDLENEFRYWVRELIGALKHGAIFAVVVGVLIAVVPENGPATAFARDFWPYLAETGFWLGMFVAMLWSAMKRAAAVVTGVLPWQRDGAAARNDAGAD